MNCALSIYIFLIVAALFLFGGLGSTSFLDPDEGMYGSIAKEMAETGDWVTPHFNGVRYFNKPPLIFWLTSVSVLIFGHSEWVIRLWSALPALGAAVLTWHLGNLLYGGYAGLLSAFVLVSSAGVLRHGRIAATDFLLVFSVTLSIYGFVRAVLADEAWNVSHPRSKVQSRTLNVGLWTLNIRPYGAILFWLGMALGVLAKGLLGLILPLMIAGLFALAVRLGNSEAGKVSRPRSKVQSRTLNVGRWTLNIWPSHFLAFKVIYSPIGILLFLALVLPWHFLAAWENPGFFQYYIIDNQFLRFFNARAFIEDDIPVGTLSFLALTLVWFSPWSLFLPAGFRAGFPRFNARSSREEMLHMVVGVWVVVVIGFFSLSASKLEHYFLPAVPALSLMVGALWGKAVGKKSILMSQKSLVVNGGKKGKDQLSSIIDSRWLNWLFGVGAFSCAAVGLGFMLFEGWFTPELVMAGFAESDVEYRILLNQGVSFPFEVRPFVDLLKQLGIVFAIGFPLAFLLFCYHRMNWSFVVLVAVAGFIGLHGIRVDLLVEPYHSTHALAQTLKTKAKSNSQIVHEGPLEYSGALPLYTERQVYIVNGHSGSLDFGSRFPEARHIFLSPGLFRTLWNGHEEVFLITRLSLEQSSLRDFPADKIRLVGHYGSRWLYTNRVY